MTLSRSSILHYWSARYGTIPVIGGKPTHTRNSAGTVADARGELYDAIINTPRFSWETDQSNTAASERRAMLLLEQAATNLLTAPSDFTNGAWTKTSVTPTVGAADPKGGSSASTLTATANGGTVVQSLAAGSLIQRTNSIWMRRRTGTGTVSVRRFDGGAYDAVTLTSDWQRVGPTLAAASTTRTFGIQFATSGDAVDVWDAEMVDGVLRTSEIASGGTRAADGFSWAFPPAPQAMMAYVRIVEGGTNTVNSGYGLVQISNAGGSDPVFLIYSPSGIYTAFHSNAGAVTSGAGAGSLLGETVELVAILFTDGSVQLIQSRNGLAVSSGARSGAKALGAAWSGAVLTLNANVSAIGVNKFADLRIVKYADVVATTAQGIMDELRAFELGPNGDVL